MFTRKYESGTAGYIFMAFLYLLCVCAPMRADADDLIDVSTVINLRNECVAMVQQIKDGYDKNDPNYKVAETKYNRVEVAANAYIDQVLFRLNSGRGPSDKDLQTSRDTLVSRADDFLLICAEP